jgi:hypothetical protein
MNEENKNTEPEHPAENISKELIALDKRRFPKL